MKPSARSVLFAVFTLSGFSGLIYESIWTHYLKLFLGHAAYAQTLVLAIFMGGMALGSWICSRWSVRWPNLLLGYALTEGVVGLIALVFHGVFTSALELAYGDVLPRLATPAAVLAFKWGLSALLILPQSVLLGMTFPLMSAGFLRRFPEQPGRSVALLYFSNSIGAAVGVLASGFLLIGWVGLPGTVALAGAINVSLALLVWRLSRGQAVPARADAAGGAQAARSGAGGYRVLLGVSLVTGASSFMYEVGWIRMLSLVLGATTHAFELMLSAFILGLALGGLFIQRVIDRVASPVRTLAVAQVAMGLLALATLLVYGQTFPVMQWLVKTLPRTADGYLLFNLSSGSIAMGVMLPAAFCAGMTLPLITLSLLQQGHGERSIGAVYAANTVGAIAGVFFAIHLGLPGLGLKGLITFGAALDLALGAALLWTAAAALPGQRLPAAITALSAAAVAGSALFVQLDPYQMASGVYRAGMELGRDTDRLVLYRDGKTATVTVSQRGLGMLSLRTNGKADASVMMTPGLEPALDEYAQALTAVLPMAVAPQARTAACIGLGSGMTTQTLLLDPNLVAVDTIEIEQAIIEGSRLFRPMVERAHADPRSAIHQDDAKTFFSSYNKTYDLIVSEPSNPWVSGVAGLFSTEFYDLVGRHLSEEGTFVQWVQLYEIDVSLVASVLKAVEASFDDYAVYAASDADLLIVARKSGRLPPPDPTLFQWPELAAALRRLHVEGPQDLELRRIGSRRFLSRLLASYPIRPNSDYHPVLDQRAARTRFLGESALALVDFSNFPVPAMEMLDLGEVRRGVSAFTPQTFVKGRQAATAMALRDFFQWGDAAFRGVPPELQARAVRLREACAGRVAAFPEERLDLLFSLSLAMTPYLTPEELEPLWATIAGPACLATRSADEARWLDLFQAVGRRDAAGMKAHALALLGGDLRMTRPAIHYLLASGMLGSLASGDASGAGRLWAHFKPQLFAVEEPDLLLRLLAAEAGG